MGVFRNYMETPDSHMRLRVYAAMGRLRRDLGIAPLTARQLIPRIDREVDEAWATSWAGTGLATVSKPGSWPKKSNSAWAARKNASCDFWNCLIPCAK